MKSLPNEQSRLPATRKAQLPAKSEAQLPGQVLTPAAAFFPFFSFQYVHQEMTLSGDGKATVKAKKVQYTDGQLDTEAFEGTLPATFFEQAVQNTQRLFADQMAWLANPFAHLLPMALPQAGRLDTEDSE